MAHIPDQTLQNLSDPDPLRPNPDIFRAKSPPYQPGGGYELQVRHRGYVLRPEY